MPVFFSVKLGKWQNVPLGKSIVSGVKEMTMQHKKYSPKTVHPSAYCRL